VEYFLIQQVIGNHGFGQAVVPSASDGGALLVGSSFVPDTTLKYSFFIRLNAQGDTVWARAYHAPNQYFQATGGIAIPNGEFIILGRTFVTAVEAFVGGQLHPYQAGQQWECAVAQRDAWFGHTLHV
jgi:hypothetical protein